LCFFLAIATPLTLSEVRSMLPPGLSAQPVNAAAVGSFRSLHSNTQTVADLLVGQCSCDLVRPRHPESREDERHLRQRYARLGLDRERIIRELERHRRVGPRRAAAAEWARDLAAFVAEHARNAGPTLYHLRFAPAGAAFTPEGPVNTRTVAAVRAAPGAWLEEGSPILIVR
jgi:hypothetical protein